LKKHFQILIFILLCLSSFENAFSQYKNDENPEKCKKELSRFYKYAKVKNYDVAYDSWKWCFENCPASNVNIYHYGLKIIKYKYKEGDKEIYGKLIDSIYTQRIAYFPNNLSKVYSSWASSLEKIGESKEKIFEKLESGFNVNPSGLSVKNIVMYFQEIIRRYKNTDHQKIFDTYDNTQEAVTIKIDKLTRQLDKINTKETKGQILSRKEQRIQKNNEINLKALGKIEMVLDVILGETYNSSNCKLLIPLYTKGLKTHKTDGKWLKRAISRLYQRECTENALFPKLVKVYNNLTPVFDSYILLDTFKIYNFNQAEKIRAFIDSEKDPYKKAKYLYTLALKFKTNPSIARQYAYEALRHQPSMGKAYLLIARLYAKSANSCGTDEFSKRMVFVAAVVKARKAKEVDPSITSLANKYIKSYTASFPSKNFPKKNSKKEFHVKCWIGETVIIP